MRLKAHPAVPPRSSAFQVIIFLFQVSSPPVSCVPSLTQRRGVSGATQARRDIIESPLSGFERDREHDRGWNAEGRVFSHIPFSSLTLSLSLSFSPFFPFMLPVFLFLPSSHLPSLSLPSPPSLRSSELL